MVGLAAWVLYVFCWVMLQPRSIDSAWRRLVSLGIYRNGTGNLRLRLGFERVGNRRNERDRAGCLPHKGKHIPCGGERLIQAEANRSPASHQSPIQIPSRTDHRDRHRTQGEPC